MLCPVGASVLDTASRASAWYKRVGSGQQAKQGLRHTLQQGKQPATHSKHSRVAASGHNSGQQQQLYTEQYVGTPQMLMVELSYQTCTLMHQMSCLEHFLSHADRLH